jgi:tetratricopeptide (TPR) repeat protein
MLADRPEMRLVSKEAQLLRSWAVRKFGGEDLGELIVWSSDESWEHLRGLGFIAAHRAPSATRPGEIFVEKRSRFSGGGGVALTKERFWAAVVFELSNISSSADFAALYDKAMRGSVSGDQFVRAMYAIEHRACLETRRVYAEKVLACGSDEGIGATPALWYASIEEAPDDAMVHWYDRTTYPWIPYLVFYDGLRYEGFCARKALDEAVNYLKMVASDGGSGVRRAEALVLLGRCYEALGNGTGCRDAFERVSELEIPPERRARVLLVGAVLCEKMGEEDAAFGFLAQVGKLKVDAELRERALFESALMHRRAGRNAEARKILRELKQSAPESAAGRAAAIELKSMLIRP